MNSLSAEGSWTFVGGVKAYRAEGNLIRFDCSNAVVTLELCAEDVVRVRMSPAGSFQTNESWVVARYDWLAVPHKVADEAGVVKISTSRFVLEVARIPFRLTIRDSSGRVINQDAPDGGMGFDGAKVIARKVLSDTDHFFGLGQRYEKSDLRGEKRNCWATREYSPVPFFLGTDGYGIFFHNTFRSEYDFSRNPYSFSAPGGGELDYYFIYGPSFKRIIDRYTDITGKPPLPPKWAFGLFYSAWTKQGGQKGLLDAVRSMREQWDWPLDGIRVHTKGLGSNFYAGPSVSWPEESSEGEGWGAFPAVDKMMEQLHGLHCRALFWETPGVSAGGAMHREGVEKKFFLLQKDGKPWHGIHGYSAPPGGLVDFLSPEARAWWGKYHEYMVDFGSDGAAGDFCGHASLDNLISPFNGMTDAEFHNVYSLLFNRATYDAYRQRAPNRRCITFGLMTWAGGQRYPMQGTQDTYLLKQEVLDEMMGCINLGLSGIPFRTYTDNVTADKPGSPLSRVAQYVSLTVAGERCHAIRTGNKNADDNYRVYGKLRYRLMPYIYSNVYETHRSGVPLVRAMVLEFQDDPKSYEAFGQYMLGGDLLIAPLWSDTTFSRDVYLPPGKWVDFWDDTVHEGGRTIKYQAPIDKVPILVKAGAMIPMAPDGQRYVDERTSPYTIHVYPHGDSRFRLYEDDGVSYEYEKGVSAITEIACRETPKQIVVVKGAPVGAYRIPARDHIFCIHSKLQPKSVMVDGAKVSSLRNADELQAAPTGWFSAPGEGKVWVKIAGGMDRKIEIVVDMEVLR